MTITNAEAIRFTNEQVRPMAEQLRDLQAVAEDMAGHWNGGINILFPNDSSAVDDGRDAEGASRLAGTDINNFITQVNTLLTQFAGAGVMDVIRKPTIRPLRV